jgi:hypothetical protein
MLLGQPGTPQTTLDFSQRSPLPRGTWNPAHPALQPGARHGQAPKISTSLIAQATTSRMRKIEASVTLVVLTFAVSRVLHLQALAPSEIFLAPDLQVVGQMVVGDRGSQLPILVENCTSRHSVPSV